MFTILTVSFWKILRFQQKSLKIDAILDKAQCLYELSTPAQCSDTHVILNS